MVDKLQTLYKVEGVSKVFGNRYVLNDVSLEINCGEIFGIIGTSGSGKTTLLNLLIGFVKPEKGNVYFSDPNLIGQNKEISFKQVDKNPDILKKLYGFAAQNPSFYPNLTVEENLNYFGSLYKLPPDTLKLNNKNLLTLMSLSQSQHVLASNLSGGMQRRLDIACSLIHDPKILILDEPTADLDPVISEQIWNLLKIINQRGTTIILSSHHLVQLEDICDRIAIIKENKIVAIGKPEEIKAISSAEEKVKLQTEPGNYNKIINILKKANYKEITGCKKERKFLVVHTKDPKQILPKIFESISLAGEKIINIEMIKPKLEQVFVKMNESKKTVKVKKKTKKKHRGGKKQKTKKRKK